MGVTLSPSRRAELARWARESDTVVVEDDYDGEFRFDRQPVGALEALDPERIVYAGTASKSLSPALRLGWLVVPEWLVELVLAALGHGETAPALDQLALADLIDTHRLDRHLRRMRTVYRRRRDTLVTALRDTGRAFEISGVAAGLHAVIDFTAMSRRESDVLRRAGDIGVGLAGLSEHWSGDMGKEGIVVGYSRPPAHHFAAAMAALVSLLSAE